MRIFFLLLLIPLFSLSQTTELSLSKYNWQFRKKGDKEWLTASIPGTVHTDLLANKLIADPYYGDNEKQLQWIENEDWEYKTYFDVSKQELNQQHIELQFEGLDTYANVFLNDSLILVADNMFRSWNVDVKKILKVGDNYLKIVFQSAVKRGKKEATKLNYTLPGDEKVFARKAQYQYGWDWGPRFVTCGIYKDIKLKYWNNARIVDVKYALNKLTDSIAELELVCEIKCEVSGKYIVSVTENWKEELGSKFENYKNLQPVNIKKGEEFIIFKYQIKNPKRWWTNGLGAQVLYPFTISLSSENETLDNKVLSIGLRTLELVQEKDSIGKSFYFKLNGVPVFMKGANYIPPDNFLPRVTKSDYEKIVQNAADANMNMLRVWGGGVYADDDFYNACDQKGILVWQDFMFACAMYPADETFVNTLVYELRDQIARLEKHTCLALWCGNNEVDEGWKNWGWQKQYHYSATDSTKIWNDYTNLFDTIIPDMVNSFCPANNELERSCFYIPSSPSIGWGHKESLQQGDAHYWGVWWGMEPFEIYKTKVGRFMSEYGFQGMPSIECFKNMGAIQRPSDRLNFDDSITRYYKMYDTIILNAHQKHPTGYKTINTYMERDFKVPKDFENYVYVSQLLQAEGMKTAIEAHRRAKPYCMGTLYWQLNDCWPVTSWSSIDYYGNWKASHYQAKRSYENIIVSINEEDDKLKINIVNDELKKQEGTVEMKLIDFKGNILWNKSIEVLIKSNSSSVYFSIDKNEFSKFDLKQIVLSASLKLNDERKISSEYYFVKPKDLLLEKPEINLTYVKDSTYQITTNVFAKDVFISSQSEYGRWSDNYFDLLPNEKKLIYLHRNNGSDLSSPSVLSPRLKSAINIKSLYDINK